MASPSSGKVYMISKSCSHLVCRWNLLCVTFACGITVYRLLSAELATFCALGSMDLINMPTLCNMSSRLVRGSTEDCCREADCWSPCCWSISKQHRWRCAVTTQCFCYLRIYTCLNSKGLKPHHCHTVAHSNKHVHGVTWFNRSSTVEAFSSTVFFVYRCLRSLLLCA